MNSPTTSDSSPPTPPTTPVVAPIVTPADVVPSEVYVDIPVNEDANVPVNVPVSKVAPQEDECTRRCLGCCQCLAGCIGCPLISAASLITGVFLTVKACLCLKCMSDEFLQEREAVCTCFGFGTGCAVSTVLVVAGYANLTLSQPHTPRQTLAYMSDMTR
uniref:Uncharacterized protein n=1 Tax=viral metagenome TaxID=1070528 RepID=A0A6C0KFH2_9ZZZZ